MFSHYIMPKGGTGMRAWQKATESMGTRLVLQEDDHSQAAAQEKSHKLIIIGIKAFLNIYMEIQQEFFITKVD